MQQPAYLRHSLVVDRDEVAGRRVDLEGLVESQCRLDCPRGCSVISRLPTKQFVKGELTISAQNLAILDLLKEVGLLLLRVCGEALLLGLINRKLDGLSLLDGVGLGILLLDTFLPPLVPT